MAVTSLKRQRRRAKGWRIKREIDADLIWERPADWPQLPEVLASDSKFVGLYKIENHDMNHIALTMTVASGTYDVDWGDGTVSTGNASGATASHTYDWSDTDLTLTSEGFKVAVVKVTPNSAGVNFTIINLNTKNSNYGSNSGLSTGWLEMRMSMPGITSSANFAVGNGSIFHRNCRSFEYVGACGVTNGTNMFLGFVALEQLKVSRSFTTACTNMSSMFQGLTRLKYIPDLDMAAVTTLSLAFGSCSQLRRVPDLSALTSCTNIANAFQNCTSLEYIPDMTTGAITSAASAFSGCASLKVAPAISNTGSCTSWSNCFLNCVSLRSVPAYNTSAATNVAALFSGCSSLEIVPALDFAAVNSTANFNNTFLSTGALRKILATGARFGHTIPSQLSSAALDVYYTNLGTASGAQTLTVSGNAVASDTPSIATAKGWTVTGS